MSDFEKCRALLYALDVLDAAGLFESPAAEALRDPVVCNERRRAGDPAEYASRQREWSAVEAVAETGSA